jgi:hypothetical protein
MDNNEEYIFITPVNKNKTKKCKGVDPELCKTREDCVLDKLGNCKKRPKNTKKNTDAIKNTPIINVITSVVEDIPNDNNTNDNPVYDPCEQKQNVEKNIKELTKEKLRLNDDCNAKKYETIKNLNLVKLMDLLIFIFKNKIENCQDLFNRFPETNERTPGYLPKPYIFESLWKIIFLLNLDNLTDGFKRKYKNSIEKNQDIEEYDYLNGDNIISNINSGSESGIADFYFTVVKDGEMESTKSENACEDPILKPKVDDVYVFTSKFYRKEKNITKYDIQDIVIEIQEKYEKNKYKIVSLVRNGAEYKNRLQRTSKEVVKQYVDTNLIYDESDLNLIYYPKLYKFLTYWFQDNKKDKKDIHNEKDWRKILKNPKEIINILDNLRFHQKYVVEYTNNIIETKEEGRFIWGAVARSGKSYMVGGLVAKRTPKIVLLILGAINETKSQFIDDLFKKYTDLKDYNIIDFQNTTKFTIDDTKKYVFVISQESLRLKILHDFCIKNPEDKVCKQKIKHDDDGNINVYNSSIIDTIKNILKEKDKIIFFDEIHQGSGTDSMQEDTIQFFYDNSPKEHKVLLIMVTATYAKPLAKYDKNIDGKDCILIEWNYDMIMKMKDFQIENVTIEDNPNNTDMYLIDVNDVDFKNKMDTLKRITTELNDKGKTCDNIAYEYVNNPELAYLLPTINTIYSGKNKDIDKDYNIIENDGDEPKINVRNNLKQIFTLNRGENRNFKYKNSVNKLLNYIYDDVYIELLANKYNFIANGEGNTHSQLWFLPTSIQNETQKKEEGEDKSIVGPMLKNLGLAIINHPKFINFNVCVVHSGKETEKQDIISKTDNDKEENNRRRVFFQCIKSSKYKGVVKNCIKDIENKSKNGNKSLIILTAQRLRLGISLPCVDVAIHMDDIKSYDIIYQSMFRVLTERAGKTHGYFVDMVLDRAIQFFYKYTRNQKKNRDIKSLTKEDVKKSLLLFDVGSIKKFIGFTSVEEPINSYSEIAENFKIDKDEKFEQFKDEIFKNKEDKDNDADDYEENNEIFTVHEEPIDITKETEKNKKQIVQLLQNLYKDRNIREELKSLIINIKYDNKTVKKGLKKKQIMSPYKGEVELQNAQQMDDEDEDEDENEDDNEDNTQLFKNITEQLTYIFTLLILFNDDRIELRNVLNTNNLDINKITNCEDDDIMYYCYLISTIDNSNKIGDIVKNNEDGKIGEIVDIREEQKQQEQKQQEPEQQEPEQGQKQGKKQTTIDVKFDSEVISYELSAFNTTVTNMSIPNNFNLKNMNDKFIKTYIKKHVDLLVFLIDKQTNMELINLFNNIKEKMKELKEKINKEKSLFEGIPLDECPEVFIDNETVLDTIRKYLTPKESEKKLFGEVFTPLNLICEMLSKLPSNVWTNPDLTWLDPANGIGNFPVVVYYKLMEGLKNKIKNPKHRSKHIIEKMLYMNELNPVNVSLSKKIFMMIDPDANPNIVKADFITDSDKILNKMRDNMSVNSSEPALFNVIIGNPPYNSLASTGDNKPYLTFTFMSISILEKNGFLLFITPPAIYDYLFQTKIHKVTTKKYSYDKILNVLTINSDNNYLKKFFKNVGSEFTYFLLENNDYEGKTNILYEKDNTAKSKIIDVSKINIETNIIKQIYTDILDNEYITIRQKVFPKRNEAINFKKAMFDNKTRRIRKKQIEDGIVKENKTNDFKFRIIDSYTVTNTFNPKIYYINKTDDDYDKKRLIVSSGPSYLYPYIIDEKSYTLSDNIHYVLYNGRDYDNLLFFLNSPLWKYIDKKYRPGNNVNTQLMSLIENIKPMPSVLFKTNEDMYDFFGLTENEILKIEETTHNKEPSNKTRKTQDNVQKYKNTKKIIINKSNNKINNKKTKKMDIKKINSLTKGGNKKTRKHKSLFKFW